MRKLKLLFVFLFSAFIFTLTTNVFAATNYFATDSWETIIKNARDGNISRYKVGDTKEVNLGTLGTHTVRVANTSTPDSCNNVNFSQSGCGFVIEFADIISYKRMNPTSESNTSNGNGNKGGWEYSEMRTYVNSTIYNALPADLKKGIIDTQVVSGHGSNDSSNFTTTDKLYLLSLTEIRGNINDSDDSAKNLARQLDYYGANNTAGKLGSSGSDDYWWTRSASIDDDYVFSVVSAGEFWAGYDSNVENGVSPAFRLRKNQEGCVMQMTGGSVYKILFDTNGGSEVAEIQQAYNYAETVGTNLEMPANPTKEGYVFKGWYADSNFTTKIASFENDLRKANFEIVYDGRNCATNTRVTTLYAKWEKESTNSEETGVSTSISNIGESGIYLTLITGDKEQEDIKICDINGCDKTTFDTNLKKIKLSTPKKEGYKFEGWYLDEEYTKQIKNTEELLEEINKIPKQLSQIISENADQDTFRLSFKLYAKWSQEVKIGNTGINQSSLFIVIGSIMVIAGAIIIFTKRKVTTK